MRKPKDLTLVQGEFVFVFSCSEAFKDCNGEDVPAAVIFSCVAVESVRDLNRLIKWFEKSREWLREENRRR